MAVLGFDLGPLRSAITELGQGVRQGAQQAQQPGTGVGGASAGDYLGYLAGLAPQAAPLQGPAAQMLTQVAQARPSGLSADFMGQLGDYARQSSGLGGPAFGLLGNLYQGTGGAGGVLPQTWADLGAFGDQLKANAAKAAAVQTTGSTVGTTGGATYTGLPSGVAQWADQTNSTFGGLGSWVPAAMLAIIQHESGGSPTAYNQAGDAWGLFQQLHLNSNDPNTQFAAAQKLAQDKLASLDESYRRNGLNPDERTRARDLFLAWAGHFDYDTGQPNAGSRDVGSGQDYTSYLNQIMPMYDNIVNGRRQASAPGAGGDWGGGLIGTPYVLGGLRGHPDAPQQGLDCSEFTAYVWGQKGVALPWNAQQQYNNTARVDLGQLQPGDLVFFQGTDPNDPDYVTHVGIYVGGGKMVNAQDNGVQYADLSSPYWQQHLAGYGRVAATSGGGTANR